MLLLASCLCQVVGAEEKTPQKSPYLQALDWVQKVNPFQKSNPTIKNAPREDSEAEPAQEKEVQTDVEPPAPEAQSETQPKLEFNPHKSKTHVSIGLGTLALQGNSGSVLEKNYEASSSVQLNLAFEKTVSDLGSFEMGLTFLSVSSELKNAVNTDMRLAYLAIPLFYKHSVAPVGQYSNFYFKGGLIPLMLLDASVDSCTNVLCGADSDLDAWLTKSQSISSSFQKYSLLGVAGAGINFLVFKEFLLDSFWLNTDLSYMQGLSNVNRGTELGQDVKISGVQLQVGLAFSF